MTRVTLEQKRLMERAAALLGMTLSDFVIASGRQAAELAIREREVMTLSERDAHVFLEALASSEPAGPRLRRAAEYYRSTVNSQ